MTMKNKIAICSNSIESGVINKYYCNEYDYDWYVPKEMDIKTVILLFDNYKYDYVIWMERYGHFNLKSLFSLDSVLRVYSNSDILFSHRNLANQFPIKIFKNSYIARKYIENPEQVHISRISYLPRGLTVCYPRRNRFTHPALIYYYDNTVRKENREMFLRYHTAISMLYSRRRKKIKINYI